MTFYRLIDHTADLGIRVHGAGPKELFENAARAMYDLIGAEAAGEGGDRRRIGVTGADWPDLMVNWLRELLYLWNGEGLLVTAVAIDVIGEIELAATVAVAAFDARRNAIGHEIKAVTYHQIQVVQGPETWTARIIFDV